MRIGITGASGMLGESLLKNLSKKHELFATSRSVGLEDKNIHWDCFDLTDINLLKNWLHKINPDVVIHCAAIIDIDLCEDNINLAKKLHIKTTEVLVNYSNNNKTRLIYISTDSVFDGEKVGSYDESDTANPINVYAKTKFLGEQLVESLDTGLILRVNIVGSTRKGKKSFSEWVLKNLFEGEPMNLFFDVYFSPLFVDDLSLIINKIIYNPLVGVYHCASRDSISKYDFGKKMADIFKLSASNINQISICDVVFKANRPKNMALEVHKISSALDINLPSVNDSIRSIKLKHDNNI